MTSAAVWRYVRTTSKKPNRALVPSPIRAPYSQVESRGGDRRSPAGVDHARVDVRRARREHQRVDAVEEPAVSGQERAAVFHAGAALHQRLEEITRLTERAADDRQRERVHDREARDEPLVRDERSDHAAA